MKLRFAKTTIWKVFFSLSIFVFLGIFNGNAELAKDSEEEFLWLVQMDKEITNKQTSLLFAALLARFNLKINPKSIAQPTKSVFCQIRSDYISVLQMNKEKKIDLESIFISLNNTKIIFSEKSRGFFIYQVEDDNDIVQAYFFKYKNKVYVSGKIETIRKMTGLLYTSKKMFVTIKNDDSAFWGFINIPILIQFYQSFIWSQQDQKDFLLFDSIFRFSEMKNLNFKLTKEQLKINLEFSSKTNLYSSLRNKPSERKFNNMIVKEATNLSLFQIHNLDKKWLLIQKEIQKIPHEEMKNEIKKLIEKIAENTAITPEIMTSSCLSFLGFYNFPLKGKEGTVFFMDYKNKRSLSAKILYGLRKVSITPRLKRIKGIDFYFCKNEKFDFAYSIMGKKMIYISPAQSAKILFQKLRNEKSFFSDQKKILLSKEKYSKLFILSPQFMQKNLFFAKYFHDFKDRILIKILEEESQLKISLKALKRK